jgi:hypothetical protein
LGRVATKFHITDSFGDIPDSHCAMPLSYSIQDQRCIKKRLKFSNSTRLEKTVPNFETYYSLRYSRGIHHDFKSGHSDIIIQSKDSPILYSLPGLWQGYICGYK